MATAIAITGEGEHMPVPPPVSYWLVGGSIRLMETLWKGWLLFTSAS